MKTFVCVDGGGKSVRDVIIGRGNVYWCYQYSTKLLKTLQYRAASDTLDISKKQGAGAPYL